jgi:hypothetical protein
MPSVNLHQPVAHPAFRRGHLLQHAGTHPRRLSGRRVIERIVAVSVAVLITSSSS